MINKNNLKRFTVVLALVACFISGTLQAQLITWGHPGYAFSGSFFFGGTNTDKLAIRFTQQGTRNVNAAWLSITQVKGTPPVYRIGIQADSEGDPDGSFIQSTDYLHTGGTGWAKVDLPESTLTDRTVYHLVVQYQSGTINSSNMINFAFAQDNFTYIPPTMMNDANLSMANWVGGAFWSRTQNAPTFLLGYMDDSQYGVPYDSSWTRLVRDTDRVAQRFLMPDSMTVNSLELRLSKEGTPPADLEYKITNLTTSATLISGVFATESQVATSGGSDIVLPISGVNLIAGGEYRLELYCETCSGSNRYRVHGRSTSNTSSPFVENTFQGGLGYGETSSDSGANWTPDLAGDMKFLFQEDTNHIFSDGFEPGGGFCGDGTVGDGEECDDGNLTAGDYCSATCQLEEELCPCSAVPVANNLSYWDLGCDRLDNGPYDIVFDGATTVYVSAPIDLDSESQPITPPIGTGTQTATVCLDSLETSFGTTNCSRHKWDPAGSNQGWRLVSDGGQNSVGSPTSLAAQACRKQLNTPNGD